MTLKSDLFKTSISYKPFKYPKFVEYAKNSEQMHWIEDELNLQDDVNQWTGKGDMALSNNERNHIHQILKLFTQSDVAVGGNYIDYLLPVFKNNEVRAMLTSFAAREFIHQRAYALLNDTLGLPESDYHAFLEYEQMSSKIDFMTENKIYDEQGNIDIRGVLLTLAKSVFNEGVSLFSAFAMLLNYSRFGKMKGMSEVTEWSIKDENLHFTSLIELFKVLVKEEKVTLTSLKEEIHLMANSIVELEDKFIDLAYEMGNIEGLTKEEIKEYIRHITDLRLKALGIKTLFGNKKNPIPWIDDIMSTRSHSNFFESRVTDYSVSGMSGEFTYE